MITLLLAGLGCDLLGSVVDHGVGHCDLRESTVTAQPFCQEWRGLIEATGSDTTQLALCETLGSEFVATECPATDTIVAGCFVGKLGDGSGSYQWYYSTEEAPLTADDVLSECGSDEFVEWFEFDAAASDFGPPT